MSLIALIWHLTIDNGPGDTKPLHQLLTDTTVAVDGTDSQCRASAVSPEGNRKVICRIGPHFAGISMTCKPGDKKESEFFIVSGDELFRVKLVCETPGGSKH